jgi:hypothetical protein
MEKSTFTRVSLSNVRFIMVIMRILVEDLLCQAVTGPILVLKYLLSGAYGHLWPCLMQGIKCHRFLRTQLQWRLLGIESPQARLLGARVCAKLGG